MYQAAICEDNPEMLELLQKTLIDGFNSAAVEVAFDGFSDGTGLLRMINDHFHYDIVFMDIEMPGIDGIEVCRQLKQNNSTALIVFVSNKDELVFQTFDVQPFRFIRKSHLQEAVPTLINALISELNNRKEKLIRIEDNYSRDFLAINVNDIYYVEAQGKNCCVYTNNAGIVSPITLSKLEKELVPYGFIQVHRSYLVNCRYIFHIKKTSICMSNQKEIPLSRHRVDEVKMKFLEYSRGE